MNVSEINIREKEYYLSAIEEHCSQIEEYHEESDSIECLFNILRDMGYLLMYGSEPDVGLLNRIKNFFFVINENTAIFAPSFIDFISLEIEAEWYEKLWLNHKDFIKDLPTLKDDSLIEEAWEKVFNYMKQRGLELIIAGLDIFAVLYSNQMFFKDIHSDGWQKSWKIFLKKSDVFFNTLFNIEEKYFFNISYSVYKIIYNYTEIKEISLQPAAKFINFIRSISKPRKSYAADSAYRIIISPEEAEEIYFNISCNYNDDSSELSKIYLYECALAEEVIKRFIIKRCLSEKASDKTKLPPISDWKLLSSSDDDFYSALPMVKAGNKEYPICVIPPRLKGFSIRNDLIKKFGSSLNGVLFCSFKKYPSDEILVRFDNYVEKDRVFELIRNTDAVKGVQNVTKLSFDEVYKFDKREEFLQEAAKAVMGLEKQPDWMLEFLKQLFFTPGGNGLDKIAKALRKIPGILEPEFKGAFAPALVQSDEQQDNYYVPVKSLKNTTFLDPDPDSIFSNESVHEAVDSGFNKEWQYIYLFVDTKANIIDEVHGPLEISGEGEKIVNVPANAECVWFFIGQSQTVNEIKTEYNKNKTLKITKQEEFYWIIYGPAE